MAMGGKAGETFTEINVTPLTDVFLVLLVIMILIAPLVNQAVLKVSPPAISTEPPPNDNKPKINADVTAAGTISINGVNIDPPDTKNIMNAIQAEQAKNQAEDMPLILNSDEDALQKDVVAVMDAAAGCNIKSMAVLPPRPGAGGAKK